MHNTIDSILQRTSALPVVVIDDAQHAIPLARALLRGGIGVIEITLRTQAAIAAITQVREHVPNSVVAAGSVRTPQDARAVQRAGAHFAVSPGATALLLETCRELNLPLLPGAATVSEAMHLFNQGYAIQKFFPAVALGGVDALAMIAGPLPEVSFCPTGGINANNAARFLHLNNVLCVGGSWIAPRQTIAKGDWHSIETCARAAQALLSPSL